jgi:hypothetical protein
MSHENAVRIAAIILLVIALLVDPFMLKWAARLDLQLLLGALVVALFIFYDQATGLICAFALITVYFRFHMAQLGVDVWSNTRNTNYYGQGMQGLVQRYVTPQNLEDAQNNVVSKKDAEIEMKGIRGVYGEAVYGAQGMDTAMPGYVKSAGAIIG